MNKNGIDNLWLDKRELSEVKRLDNVAVKLKHKMKSPLIFLPSKKENSKKLLQLLTGLNKGGI